MTSVDEPKIFNLITEKVTYGLIKYATMQIMQLMQSCKFSILQFYVIIAHHSVFTPHVSKTCLPISSLNVRDLTLN